MNATRISEMKTANGLSDRTCFSQVDSAAGSVMIRYMTPQKYREIRRKNGISSDTSAIAPPSRATISAAPVLNIVCSRMAGISSSQYTLGYCPLITMTTATTTMPTSICWSSTIT